MGDHLDKDKRCDENKIDSTTILSGIQFEEVFFHSSGHYCVCFIDIAGSTQAVSRIKEGKDRAKYYSIFLNYISAIAHHSGAKIIKNAGDGLFWYFPKSQDYSEHQVFERVIDCCMTVAKAHTRINDLMSREGLPNVDYRMSADYGRLEIALTKTSVGDDFFGPTMNMCVKINSRAPLNGLVIGENLYKKLMRHVPLYSAYHFEEMKEEGRHNTFGLLKRYSIFLVSVKTKYTVKHGHHLPHSLEKRFFSDITATYNNNSLDHEPTKSLERMAEGKGENTHLSESRLYDHPINIMIIDDEPDALLSFMTFLENKPYGVEVFSNAKEALQKFALLGPSHYSLVISDIRMPDMNGLQLYNSLKAINRNVRVIFVTALDIAQEVISILPSINEKDIIKKPVSKSEFVKIVEKSPSQSNH